MSCYWQQYQFPNSEADLSHPNITGHQIITVENPKVLCGLPKADSGSPLTDASQGFSWQNRHRQTDRQTQCLLLQTECIIQWVSQFKWSCHSLVPGFQSVFAQTRFVWAWICVWWCAVSFFFLFYLFGTLIKFVACQGATVVQRRHFQPRSEDFTRFLVACLDYPLDAVPGSISASNGQ